MQGRALMAPYLPRNGASGSPYSEGGALYALGLTYAVHGAGDMRAFLLQSLRDTAHEVWAVSCLFVSFTLSVQKYHMLAGLCCTPVLTARAAIVSKSCLQLSHKACQGWLAAHMNLPSWQHACCIDHASKPFNWWEELPVWMLFSNMQVDHQSWCSCLLCYVPCFHLSMQAYGIHRAMI